MPEGKATDVVLDPSQCVHIIDATKGTVECHVGPCRLDLAEKDRPVMFDGKTYQRCRTVEDAIQSFPVANEGDYIVLMNPAKDNSHPPGGKVTGAAELTIGRSVVIPGPASFPLWPGQIAKVIKGHQLRSNQYLVARVINETDAQANWGKVVMKPSDSAPAEKSEPSSQDGEEAPPPATVPQDAAEVVDATKFTMGKEIVIKGTDVSFFIPPTGMAVVVDHDGNHVRDAVTLETVEYCVLRDEDGNKRYVRGPDVVFPEPTEQFVTTEGSDGKTSRKFRAVELNEISGIHVKVIADYTEENAESTTTYHEGDELFITGKQQKIYFPRPEHAIIKYGRSERHFAVAIPEGEARYVLDRMTGEIGTLKGPKMALLDPTKEVFVRRVLDQKTVALWFPGNQEALSYNANLEEIRAALSSKLLSEETTARTARKRGAAYSARSSALEDFGQQQLVGSSLSSQSMNFAGDVGDIQTSYAHSERAVEEFGGDEIKRKDTFTPPRTITLDTKYEGAVTVRVWTGFAVQVVSATGEREVVVGPYPRILDYDEMLEIISLSTSEHGKAKNFREPLRTPYLRVKNNRVSDVVKVQTADLVDVTIEVSYRVNFEGDKNKWFNVENYVGLLCERCRSILRGVAKRMSIRDFMADSVTVVRDALLGEKPVVEVGGEENEPGQPVLGARPGLTFDENDMHLYDIEVLDTRIGDGSIAEEITRAQHAIVTNEIGLDQDRQSLALTLARQEIQQKVDAAIAQTQMAKIGKDREVAAAVAAKDAEEAAHSIEHQKRQLELTTAKEDVVDASAARELERAKTKDDHRLEFDRSRAAIERETEASHTEAFKTRVESISPGLIAALQVHGDKVLTAEMIKELGAVAAMTGDSVEGVFKKIMQGSVLADVFTGDGGAAKGIAANALRRSGLRSEIEK